MGYSEYLQTWQMKHRLNTEVHANAKFKQIFKKLHRNCTFKDPGMTICERFFFISVSSDLEVCCSSHGERLVEIKCLGTLIGKIPNSDNYSTHIEKQNDSIYLKNQAHNTVKFKVKWLLRILDVAIFLYLLFKVLSIYM